MALQEEEKSAKEKAQQTYWQYQSN